jgi:hypothetical protein
MMGATATRTWERFSEFSVMAVRICDKSRQAYGNGKPELTPFEVVLISNIICTREDWNQTDSITETIVLAAFAHDNE